MEIIKIRSNKWWDFKYYTKSTKQAKNGISDLLKREELSIKKRENKIKEIGHKLFCDKSILSRSILDRLLNQRDNNWTRNYLLGSIEYCLLSSSKIGLLSNIESDIKNDGDVQSPQQPQTESIGLIFWCLFYKDYIPGISGCVF